MARPSDVRPGRLVLLLGIAGLALGVWGGLVRIGWAWPVPAAVVPGIHGPLMVSGFVGTLISVERAIGLGRRWAYAPPILTGVGSLALLVPAVAAYGPYAVLAGSAAFVAVLAVIARRQPAAAAGAMIAAALLWAGGNALWVHGFAVHRLAPWWIAFIVLLIAGERRELSRVVRLSAASRAGFGGAVAFLAAATASTLVEFDLGMRVFGFALVGLAMWLLTQDIAQRSVAVRGLPRFMAAGLLAGYVWLGVAGVALVHLGGVPAGPGYDLVLHAVFLGFVFSMIMAHAPIIFPSVLGRPIPFRAAMWAPLVFLHASLALRVAGDALPSADARLWGSLLNGVAILLFFLTQVAAART